MRVDPLILGGPRHGLYYSGGMDSMRYPLPIRLRANPIDLYLYSTMAADKDICECRRTTIDNPAIQSGCRNVPIMLDTRIDRDDAASLYMVTDLGLETRRQRAERLLYGDR